MQLQDAKLIAEATTSMLSTEAVHRTALEQLGREIDPADFTICFSFTKMFGSTAGPFRGGIAGQAMTPFRITLFISTEAVFAFAGERLYGFAPHSYALVADLLQGNLDGLGQVDSTTGKFRIHPRRVYPAKFSESNNG